MTKVRCKNRKYRKTIIRTSKSKSPNTANKKAWNLFIESFMPTFGVGLARSINCLMLGFVFWLIKKLFLKQDLHQLLEILSNFLYKNHCEVKMLVSQEHPLFKLENKKRLASILKTNVNYFKDMENYYKVYPFKKIVGEKERNLFNTDFRYKYLLRKLNKLFCQVNIPDYVYAGVPKKDFLSNALVHSENSYIQNVDIKNFFPSTYDSFVYGLFLHKFETSPDIAKILSLLTTYPNYGNISRHIPQGFPTSTILSFLSYFDLFNGLDNICKQNGIHFTLFVDDMTFSSNKRIPKSFLKHVNAIVKKYNLELHPSKIYRNGPYKYKNVTGVIIDPTDKTLKAPNRLQKRMYDNFQAIHNCSINSYSDYVQFKQLVLKTDGQLRSIKRIEPNRQFIYITKVLNDIKGNFLYPTVKGASREILTNELEFFYNKNF